jgi:hypothetical protein
MKENRFIELVNLYVDRQISPAEAAELESELQSDARRRQIYQQYCRMHRATQMVYESFRDHAGREAPAPSGKGGSLVRLESARRRQYRWAYALGGVAAAASLAFLVTRTLLPEPAGMTPSAAVASAPAPSTARAPAIQVANPAAAFPVSLRHPLMMENEFPSRIDARQRRPASLAIGESLFDDDVFTSKQILPDQSPRPYRIRRDAPGQAPSEYTAFQFQR